MKSKRDSTGKSQLSGGTGENTDKKKDDKNKKT